MKTAKTAAIISIAALCLFLAGCNPGEDIQKLTIDDIDFSTVKDGSYTQYQNNFPVTAKVEATVEGGKVVGIKLLRHFHGPDHGADEIVGRIIQKQSLRVDAVSGSTLSSIVLLKAVESALKKGL
jgi:uncharacterized protein with FMN-binding domain